MVKFTEREAGVYRATFKSLDTGFPITDRDTGEEVIRWRWVFQDVGDATTVGEMDTITSPSLGSRTNGLKFFSGMLGRPPTKEDDTDAFLGKDFDVTWGPNQNGRLTIVAVNRPTAAGKAKEPVSVAPAAPQPMYEGQELP